MFAEGGCWHDRSRSACVQEVLKGLSSEKHAHVSACRCALHLAGKLVEGCQPLQQNFYHTYMHGVISLRQSGIVICLRHHASRVNVLRWAKDQVQRDPSRPHMNFHHCDEGSDCHQFSSL